MRWLMLGIITLLCAACASHGVPLVVATPIATPSHEPTPAPSAEPIELAGDDAVVSVTPDGVVRITAADGTVTVSTLDALAPKGPSTSIIGVVLTSTGQPVGRAFIHVRRPDGSGCTGTDIGYLSSPDGTFRIGVRPGSCLIAASHGEGVGNPVLAQVSEGHATPVVLILPSAKP